MNRIVIKQSNPASGKDNKTFRAYSPALTGSQVDQPLGVTANSTAEPASIGARCCAVKTFIKFAEPKAERDEIETRIAMKLVTRGLWIATLEPKTTTRPAAVACAAP